ncbi:kelch-like protein 30 [Saccoglossus kowalevskii]
MYTGVIAFSEIDVEDILQGSDYFGMEEVRSFCTAYLQENVTLTNTNCFVAKSLGDKFNIKALSTAAKEYFRNHCYEILSTDTYLPLSYGQLLEFLEDDLNIVEIVKDGDIVCGEESVLKAVFKWVEYDPEIRTAFAPELLKRCVRFKSIQKKPLDLLMEGNPELRSLIDDKLLYTSNKERTGDSSVDSQGVKRARRGRLVDVLAVCGGTNYSVESNHMYANVLEQRRWIALADLPEAVFGAAAVCHAGKVYVCGGLVKRGKSSTVRSTLFCYDPMLNSWKILSPMNTAVQRHSFAACNSGHLYVIGGLAEHTVCRDVQCYNIQSDVWTNKRPLPAARCDTLAFTSNNRVYIVGGWDSSVDYTDSSTGTLCCYNPETDTWIDLAPLPPGCDVNTSCWVLPVDVEEGRRRFLVTDFRRQAFIYHVDKNVWTEVGDSFKKLRPGSTAKSCCVCEKTSRVLTLSSCRSFFQWDRETLTRLERIPPSPQQQTNVAITLPHQFSTVLQIPCQFI